MENNKSTTSDLEEGKRAGGQALGSPSPPENPKADGRLERMTKFIMSRCGSTVARIYRLFQLKNTATKQKVLLLLCVAAVILDPLFFYIPTINEASKCMKSDRKLGAIAITLRSIVDFLHFMLWWWYYSDKWKSERSLSTSASASPAAATAPGEDKKEVSTAASTAEKKEVSTATSTEEKKEVSTVTSTEKKEEVSLGNSYSFSPRNSKWTGLLLEILSILPVPQAETLAILLVKGSLRWQLVIVFLKFTVLGQFVLRIFRVFPSFYEATTNSFTLLKSRFWIGAGFNLLLFMISSNALGAFWYLLSAGRLMDCWKSACRSQVGCNIEALYCGGHEDKKSYLDVSCPIRQATNSSDFDFGIYLSALESNIVGLTRFPLKLSYCFWWGLRNLSSLGQNLNASAYEWEILFSICISVLGLILFSFFIGNMQAFFQYRTNEDLQNMKGKMDKVINKQKELLKWEPFQGLSQKLKEDIISCVEDKWLETPDVNLRNMIVSLPKDLGQKIKLEILSELKKKVKLFQALNMRAPNSTIKGVKPEVFAEGTLVFRKDHPIDKMVFVVHGKLMKQSGTDRSTAQELQAWDFFGEELLKKIVCGSSTAQSSSIGGPISTADIKTCTKVEAFILDEEDLQSLVDESNNTFEEIMQLIEEHRNPRRQGHP